MATIGDAGPSESHSGSDADDCSKKAIAPLVTDIPTVPHTEDHTMEDTTTEIEKIKKQMNADLAEAQRLRKRIKILQGERVFESNLFRFCRELINMRLARGRTPLSNAEKAHLEEIQKLAQHGMDQYTAAKGSFPPFVNPFPKKCPPMV